MDLCYLKKEATIARIKEHIDMIKEDAGLCEAIGKRLALMEKELEAVSKLDDDDQFVIKRYYLLGEIYKDEYKD